MALFHLFSDVQSNTIDIQYTWPEASEPKTLSVHVTDQWSVRNAVALDIAHECDWHSVLSADDPALCLIAKFRRGSKCGGGYAYKNMLNSARQAYQSACIAMETHPDVHESMLDFYNHREASLDDLSDKMRSKRLRTTERAERLSEDIKLHRAGSPSLRVDLAAAIDPEGLQPQPRTGYSPTSPSYSPTSPSYSPTSPHK